MAEQSTEKVQLREVVAVGVTNHPTLLDRALLRPGRFDEIVYVPVPEEEGRLRIRRIHTEHMPLGESES